VGISFFYLQPQKKYSEKLQELQNRLRNNYKCGNEPRPQNILAGTMEYSARGFRVRLSRVLFSRQRSACFFMWLRQRKLIP